MAKKIEEEVIDVQKVDPKADWVEIAPLFYDKERYSAPVFVGVNGKTFLIKRGVSGIKVPRYVKEVLDQSAYQTQMASKYMQSIEGDKNLGEF